MATAFENSLFSTLTGRIKEETILPQVLMGGYSGSRFDMQQNLNDIPIVIFDFETTGLNYRADRIIEIGAVKFLNRQEVDRFTALIHPGCSVTAEITRITGITDEMLVGAPPMENVLPKFHDFFRGCLGVAHNAEFDSQFLKFESLRLGIHCDYYILCTLRLARALVQCERRNLDALAAHYGLTFQSRHRSIGDILVTADVLWRILDENQNLTKLVHLLPYKEAMN